MGRRVGVNAARKRETPEQALGSAITDLRLKRKWSHMELSERLGYSAKYLVDPGAGSCKSELPGHCRHRPGFWVARLPASCPG